MVLFRKTGGRLAFEGDGKGGSNLMKRREKRRYLAMCVIFADPRHNSQTRNDVAGCESILLA